MFVLVFAFEFLLLSWCDVLYIIILLYLTISYTILFYSSVLIFPSSLPPFCPSLPFSPNIPFLSFRSIHPFLFPILSSPHSNLSSILSSPPSHLPHLIYLPSFPTLVHPDLSVNSKYTCRHLDILIYIINPTILTPHVLSDGNVEWCSFNVCGVLF